MAGQQPFAHELELLKRAVAFHQQGELAKAEPLYLKILKTLPEQFDALHLLGVLRSQQNKLEDGVRLLNAALRQRPQSAEALANLGNALQGLGRTAEALDAYGKALAINPRHVDALQNRGNVLQHLKRYGEALASYDAALALAPLNPEVMYNRAAALGKLRKLVEALEGQERVLAMKPDHRHALNQAAHLAMTICDWARSERIARILPDQIRQQKSVIAPFTALLYCDDPALQLQSARLAVRDKLPVLPQPMVRGSLRRSERIRVAYLSEDFREHPVAYAVAGLLERHDRSRFEIIGIALGETDDSAIGRRVAAACDGFHVVNNVRDVDAAKLVHGLKADIAVDLTGHTTESRSRLLAYRPAPVQVNYLGYAGTCGGEYMDYILADGIVIPREHEDCFSEKVVRLPMCYLARDPDDRPGGAEPTRREHDLPERGMVFCVFTQSQKVTAPMFDVWMRLLARVPDSVLWLSQMNDVAAGNLRRAAAARSVDPGRLVFTKRVGREEHLARHRLADLFLDTAPYNAHSTFADALSAGLPVVTCAGKAFAGRVGMSLLHTAGVPELVTGNLAEYEALAVQLATEPELLRGFRDRLNPAGRQRPLFDLDALRSAIETAYTTMWERRLRNEAPAGFDVPVSAPT